jgi:hypothetical protein
MAPYRAEHLAGLEARRLPPPLTGRREGRAHVLLVWALATVACWLPIAVAAYFLLAR